MSMRQAHWWIAPLLIALALLLATPAFAATTITVKVKMVGSTTKPFPTTRIVVKVRESNQEVGSGEIITSAQPLLGEYSVPVYIPGALSSAKTYKVEAYIGETGTNTLSKYFGTLDPLPLNTSTVTVQTKEQKVLMPPMGSGAALLALWLGLAAVTALLLLWRQGRQRRLRHQPA
jgi:hypothetical protein